MEYALVNRPSPALSNCVLTFIDREPIDYDLALHQHHQYCKCLTEMGLVVWNAEINKEYPDGVFVEDVAIALDELMVITSMGKVDRRGELSAMAELLGTLGTTASINLPATIEGGDVLRLGRTLYVGVTCRTNRAGIAALAAIVEPFGYTVVPVAVHGCLHLKTCITALTDDTFIHNPAWFDTSAFSSFTLLPVAEAEPFAANVLRVGDKLLLNAAYPRTAEAIARRAYPCWQVDISEFGKAEAGLTCMSLIFSR